MAINKDSLQIVDGTKSKKETFSKTPNHDGFLKGKLLDYISDPKRSYHDVLMYIQNEIQESTRTISFNYKVKCFKEDGAYALSKAVEEVNGFTTQKNERAPSGGNPPEMLDVKFSDGSHIKVPFGTILLPTFGEDAYVEMRYHPDLQIMVLKGQCEKRFQCMMDEIVDRTNWRLSTDSIYRGKAIKITEVGVSPEFIDLSNIEKTHLFLTPEAEFATEPIEARIEQTEACIKAKMDLKFGVLLEGNYGTGKTLYAFKLALKAIRNGWTFIYCPDPAKVKFVMQTANMLNKNGKGAVIFVEDIDKILHERTNDTNEISLLMDGGETKDSNVITILTTNHIDRIDPTFLRGKRIGSIVTLGAPDAGTVKKMIEAQLVDEYGNSLLEEDCMDAALEIEANKIVPAFIAEILDRVKAHLIFSRKKTVSCDDIINSVRSYKKQMEIASVRADSISDNDQLAESLKKVLKQESSADQLAEVLKKAGFDIN